MEIVVPDVDAMIEEITAQVTDPTRNPNVGGANRDDDRGSARDEDARARDDGGRDSGRSRDDDRVTPDATRRPRSARERINERFGRGSESRPSRNADVPSIVPGGRGDDEDIGDDCFPFCD